MKAITIKQPWASMIVDGTKVLEIRSWPTNYRGPIAIHAGKEIDRLACQEFGYDPDRIPRGVVLATAQLTDCADLKVGEWRGFGWSFDIIRKFVRPIPAKGKLGFWNWEKP